MSATTLDELISRLRRVEDLVEIQQLLSTHPLAVDSGSAEFWLEFWTEDSVVDRLADPDKHSGDFEGVYGKDSMYKEITSPELEALREGGLAHFTTPAEIVVEGDLAIATNYLQLIAIEDGQYRLRRLVLSRWELRREDGAWKITKRTIRPTGHEDTRNLMASAPSLSRG